MEAKTNWDARWRGRSRGGGVLARGRGGGGVKAIRATDLKDENERRC